MFSKPKLSGCQNRKRKAKTLKDAKASSKLLCTYLTIPSSSTGSSIENERKYETELHCSDEFTDEQLQQHCTSTESPHTSIVESVGITTLLPLTDENKSITDHCSTTLLVQENSGSISEYTLSLRDPASWPVVLNANVRDCIIIRGPFLRDLEKYPMDESKRSFSNVFFYRLASNGEKVRRRWLVYSSKNNSVFCFCCKLFNTALSSTTLSDQIGNSDWRHIGTVLSRHEISTNHLKCYEKWVEAEQRLSSGTTIDDENQKIITQEKERWNNVLERLLAITQYLVQHQMAFRGTNETLYKKDNGNYLGLVELIAKFDPVMKDHISRVLDNEKKKGV